MGGLRRYPITITVAITEQSHKIITDLAYERRLNFAEAARLVLAEGLKELGLSGVINDRR
jgi:hypothetical protein